MLDAERFKEGGSRETCHVYFTHGQHANVLNGPSTSVTVEKSILAQHTEILTPLAAFYPLSDKDSWSGRSRDV